VTKANTPVEQIPNKMIKREKLRSRIEWEQRKGDENNGNSLSLSLSQAFVLVN